jgi:hypothetical protein
MTGDRPLTPTAELILDVLAARYRTGEKVWPFSTRYQAAIRLLEERGLIWQMDGDQPYTTRVGFTAAGTAMLLTSTYRSPLEHELEAAHKILALAQTS